MQTVLTKPLGVSSLNGSEGLLSFRLTGCLEAPWGMTVPTAGKPRQVLALLLIHAGSIVPISSMLEELWGGTAPRSAQTTIQTYILHLRRALGDPGGREWLKTKPGGYLLDIDPCSTDAGRFLSNASRRILKQQEQEPEHILRAATAALQLLRGPALADVAADLVIEPWITSFNEICLSIQSIKIASTLQLGLYLQVLPELRALCARYPLHENFALQLMEALFQAGRRGEALQVGQAIRHTLANELGLSPSPQISELYQKILG